MCLTNTVFSCCFFVARPRKPSLVCREKASVRRALMPNQVVNGTLDVEGPAQAKPFNVLTVDAGSFGNPANSQVSYFILARDIGAAPPKGRAKFSVRGDGL